MYNKPLAKVKTMSAEEHLHNFTLLGAEYLSDHPEIGVTYLVFMVVFMVTGTIGNVLVIGAILVNKNLRTVGNMFIVNLAVADLCVTGFIDPFAIVGFLEGELYFVLRPELCVIIACVCLTSCLCSLLSIGAISVNRYVHICHYRYYDYIYTKNKMVVMTIMLWVCSFMIGISCFLGWGNHGYDRKTMSCVYDRVADYSFTIFFCSIGVGLPLLIIFLCYIHIYIFVRNSKRRLRKGLCTRSRSLKSSDMRFLKTVLLIVCVFMACWVPYVTVLLYDREDQLSPIIHTFAIMAAHMNSSLNFILYGVTNRHFRQAYLQVLRIIDPRRLWQKNCKMIELRNNVFYMTTEKDESGI